MESAYSFIKTTLLGLILGVLIVLLLQVNYLADTIKNSSGPQSGHRRDHTDRRQEGREVPGRESSEGRDSSGVLIRR